MNRVLSLSKSNPSLEGKKWNNKSFSCVICTMIGVQMAHYRTSEEDKPVSSREPLQRKYLNQRVCGTLKGGHGEGKFMRF